MIETLSEKGYIIIPNFIDKAEAEHLASSFKEESALSPNKGDSQVPDCPSVYNYKPFLQLLCNKTETVSKLVGEEVLPTYSYARLYGKGSALKKHVDRGACEVSLSLHLMGDKPWPVKFKRPGGKVESVTLSPGDAVAYLGEKVEHYRNKYSGKEYCQVFLHYVLSNGDNSSLYFDKVSSPIPESISDYIVSYKGAIPDDICELILREFQDSEEWVPTTLSYDGEDNTIRNCDQIVISSPEVISKNRETRGYIDSYIHSCIGGKLKEYCRKNGYLSLCKDTGYALLRYKEGGFYIQHVDEHPVEQRKVSCSIQVNDSFEGGELCFFNKNVIIPPSKGSLTLFPSNFMFPHEISPVTEGVRYSIVTWLA